MVLGALFLHHFFDGKREASSVFLQIEAAQIFILGADILG